MRLRTLLALAGSLAFLATAAAQAPTTQPAQPPRPQQGQFPTPLYRMNDVSKSLNLSQNQLSQLNDMTGKVQSQFQRDFQRLNSLPERDQAAQRQQLLQQYGAAWTKSARDIINEQQLNRYNQLNLQYQGFDALLNDPMVQNRLNINADQQKQLRDSATWSQQQLQDINRRAASDRDAATRLYQDYWKDRQSRFNKILNDQQMRTWQQLTGNSYNFQPNFPSQP